MEYLPYSIPPEWYHVSNVQRYLEEETKFVIWCYYFILDPEERNEEFQELYDIVSKQYDLPFEEIVLQTPDHCNLSCLLLKQTSIVFFVLRIRDKGGIG